MTGFCPVALELRFQDDKLITGHQQVMQNLIKIVHRNSAFPFIPLGMVHDSCRLDFQNALAAGCFFRQLAVERTEQKRMLGMDTQIEILVHNVIFRIIQSEQTDQMPFRLLSVLHKRISRQIGFASFAGLEFPVLDIVQIAISHDGAGTGSGNAGLASLEPFLFGHCHSPFERTLSNVAFNRRDRRP